MAMTARLFKRIPYGKSNFRDIILSSYAYIDKTRFIEELENEDVLRFLEKFGNDIKIL
jgi:hypothetical protein